MGLGGSVRCELDTFPLPRIFLTIKQAMDLGGSARCELDTLPLPKIFLTICSVFLGAAHHVGAPSVLFAGPKNGTGLPGELRNGETYFED